MGRDSDFPTPGVGVAANLAQAHEIVEARRREDKPLLLKSAIEGHVLVKNTNNALPLKKPRLLSVLSYSAKDSDTNMVGNPSAWNVAFQSGNVSDIAARIGLVVSGVYQNISQPALGGAIVSAGGSGATSLATFVSPMNALINRADEDDTQIFWNFKSPNPEVVGVSDACLIFANAYATEVFNRVGLWNEYTDGLILNVAEKCSNTNTTVIFQNAGIRLVDQWIDHPNVTAVVFGHFPGQYTGKAIVSLSYGDSNFSGKLPYTAAKNESDHGALLSPTYPSGEFTNFPQSEFDEGVYVDYRRFDKEGI